MHDSWRLGYFNSEYLKTAVEVNTFCKELKDNVTIHLDSMATFSFMKPSLFDSLRDLHKTLSKPEIIHCGNGEFKVQKYIDLKFRNISGDYVPIRFFSSPGLKDDSRVNYLIGLGPQIRLGFDVGKVNPNIVVRNELSEYESLNDDEYDSYNLFKNLEESQHLYKGKSRADIDHEYLSLLVSHVEDEKARYILLKKLYQYPLVVGTRDKYNISYIPGFKFKAEFKPDAVWHKKKNGRRLPKTQELQVESDIKKYEDAVFIKRARDVSLHTADILVVQKKPPKNPPYDWKPEFRLCVNFTEFNKNSKDITEQIPDQVEIIRSVGKKKYYISVDVRQAFHHLLVDESMYPYLRMIDHRGIVWIWIRTPYGLKQIPSLFNLILMTYLPKPWISYFDDIVANVDTLEEYEEAIDALFKWCYKMNVTLHIPKSDWYVKELDILGYKISQNAILPNSKAVENVLSLTKPENKNQLQALLGVINYIRKFIPDLARYLVPMNKLLRKTASIEFKTDTPRILDKNVIHGGNIYHPEDYKVIYKEHDGKSNIFNENLAYVFTKGTVQGKKVSHGNLAMSLSKWDKECDEALARIQEICKKLPMLVPPNFDKQFILYTDADEEAIGATLLQEHDGKYLPVEFGSMALSKKHHDYWNISEKEVFAIVYFMDKWKKFFNHRLDTIVYCDNESVCKLLNNNKMTSKLLRWKGQLLRYNAEFRGISSGNNAIADYLSRIRATLLNADSNTPRYSNGKPYLEYLDNPSIKPTDPKTLEPLDEQETTRYKFRQKLKSKNERPIFFDPEHKANKKPKLQDQIVFNEVSKDITRPYCKKCNITMAYSTPNKYYNIENTGCKECKMKINKHQNMWVCTKPTNYHENYQICNKCAKKQPYNENMAKMYYMTSYDEEPTTNYCYVHLDRKDYISKTSKDEYYDIKLPCTSCNNKHRLLEPFIKSDLYGESITKCDLCPFRIPDDHILYHCFNKSHQNGYDLCVVCAFKLAGKELSTDNKHHPDATPRMMYKSSMRNPDEIVPDITLPDTLDLKNEEFTLPKQLRDLKIQMNELKQKYEVLSHKKSHNHTKQPTYKPKHSPSPTNKPSIYKPLPIDTYPTIKPQNPTFKPVLGKLPEHKPYEEEKDSDDEKDSDNEENNEEGKSDEPDGVPEITLPRKLKLKQQEFNLDEFNLNKLVKKTKTKKYDKLELDEHTSELEIDNDEKKEDDKPPDILNQIDDILNDIDLDDEIEQDREDLLKEVNEDIVNLVQIHSTDFDKLQKIFESKEQRQELNDIIDGKSFSELQLEDADLSIIINWLKDFEFIALLPQKIEYDLGIGRYKLENDTLYYNKYPNNEESNWRLVIPKLVRVPLLHALHNRLLHPGVVNLIKAVKQKYYWYKFTNQIKEFVSKCRVCQDCKSKKAVQHAADFVQWRPSDINQVIAIDFTKPSTVESPEGYKKVLTIIDLYDGWLTYIPTKGETADDWMLALEKYTWRNGTPETILCDNGSSFNGIASQRFRNIFGCNVRTTAAFNPQSNGTAERSNRFLKDCLATIGVHLHINSPETELHWHNYLDYIAFIHNCSLYPPTGLAPWTIRNGSKVPDVTKLNWDTYGDLLTDLKGAQDSASFAKKKAQLHEKIKRIARKNSEILINKKYQNYLKEARNKPYHGIKIGDKIDIKENRFIGKSNSGRTNKAKLRLKWRGPYTVLKVNASGTSFEVARLADEAKTATFWANIRTVRRSSSDEQTHDHHIKKKKKLEKAGYVFNNQLKKTGKNKEKEE